MKTNSTNNMSSFGRPDLKKVGHQFLNFQIFKNKRLTSHLEKVGGAL